MVYDVIYLMFSSNVLLLCIKHSFSHEHRFKHGPYFLTAAVIFLIKVSKYLVKILNFEFFDKCPGLNLGCAIVAVFHRLSPRKFTPCAIMACISINCPATYPVDAPVHYLLFIFVH